MIEPLSFQNRDAAPSPALVLDLRRIERNLDRMIAIAGRPQRLRPHFKTHKTREILQLELARGITKHKCATLAEAEVLAQGGASDILLAYPLVGPNIGRYGELVRRYPQVRIAAVADSAAAIGRLNALGQALAVQLEVLVDVDVGQQRTGAGSEEAAALLGVQVSSCSHLRFGGLHLYDGHNHGESLAERAQIAAAAHQRATTICEQLARSGIACPRRVFGGTPAFVQHAELAGPDDELSPGTCVLHDATYARRYPELGFACAAQVLTRLVSLPQPGRATFDAGTKALASDPPLQSRAVLCGVEGQIVLHNEEHLTLAIPAGCPLEIGTPVWAVPGHICPTVALHERALVIADGNLVGYWAIAARNRLLSWEK